MMLTNNPYGIFDKTFWKSVAISLITIQRFANKTSVFTGSVKTMKFAFAQVLVCSIAFTQNLIPYLIDEISHLNLLFKLFILQQVLFCLPSLVPGMAHLVELYKLPDVHAEEEATDGDVEAVDYVPPGNCSTAELPVVLAAVLAAELAPSTVAALRASTAMLAPTDANPPVKEVMVERKS